MEENRKILVITIDISESVKGMITVHENDDPNHLSEDFITKYSLDKTMKKPLVSVIKSHQEKFKREKKIVHRKNASQGQEKLSFLEDSTTERILQSSLKKSESVKRSQVNYGHFLYDKGIKMKEVVRTDSAKKAQEKECELKKELTFKPQISKNSKELAKNQEKRTEKDQEHVKELMIKADLEEMKECYFVPMINSKSSKIQSNSTKNIFNSLYEDARTRMRSRENSTTKSKDSPFSRLDEKKSQEIESVVERLFNAKKKNEAEAIRTKNYEENFDKVTGQRLFTPITGRKPFNSRSEKPIWDELYSLKDLKKHEDAKDIFEKTAPVSNTNSSKMYEKFKTQKFEQLFQKIDKNHLGKINAENASFESIDTQAQRILKNLFDEIKTSTEGFGIEEFVEKVETIYQKLSTLDKMILVKNDFQLKKENFSFNPVINKNATTLAKSSTHLGKTLYERTKAAKEIKELKIRKAKELRENEMFLKTIS